MAGRSARMRWTRQWITQFNGLSTPSSTAMSTASVRSIHGRTLCVPGNCAMRCATSGLFFVPFLTKLTIPDSGEKLKR